MARFRNRDRDKDRDRQKEDITSLAYNNIFTSLINLYPISTNRGSLKSNSVLLQRNEINVIHEIFKCYPFPYNFNTFIQCFPCMKLLTVVIVYNIVVYLIIQRIKTVSPFREKTILFIKIML